MEVKLCKFVFRFLQDLYNHVASEIKYFLMGFRMVSWLVIISRQCIFWFLLNLVENVAQGNKHKVDIEITIF